jgi:hypothetical protein
VRNRFKMSQQKDEKKRVRAPNFPPDEKVALLNLIKKYSHIIENKKTDAVTWQESKAWGEIIMKEIGTIQLAILQRSERLQIKMIEETERKLTIQSRREEELHQFEIRKQELDATPNSCLLSPR